MLTPKMSLENNNQFNAFKNATVIAQYNNGNYMVILLSDGTKIRYTDDNELIPEYPESIDLCITKKCKRGCMFCYENCLPTGKEAGSELINAMFWEDMPPYTEIAINGNDMDWEYMPIFLEKCHNKKLIVNITVTVNQFIENYYKLHEFKKSGYITGIGISIGDIDEWCINPINTAQLVKLPAVLSRLDAMKSDKEFAIMLDSTDDIVFHSVLGINDFEKIKLFTTTLRTIGYKKPIKLLFLGYKTKGRGVVYQHLYSNDIKNNIEDIKRNYSKLSQYIDVMAFDNLGVEQLQLENEYPSNEWYTKYLGNDGLFSMYIDGTAMTYAKNSCTPDNERFACTDMTSMRDMFQAIRNTEAITN